jgi:hypothetical protein
MATIRSALTTRERAIRGRHDRSGAFGPAAVDVLGRHSTNSADHIRRQLALLAVSIEARD